MVKIIVIEEEIDQFAKKLEQCLKDDLIVYWETKTVLHCKFEEYDSITQETYLRDAIVHSVIVVDYTNEGDS